MGKAKAGRYTQQFGYPGIWYYNKLPANLKGK